ncbi:hypothetical protein BC830DRAFT_431146 [Chytriomyces sp. MP71]|nr:hypothetical protein BC830DRAFT_431146 [Chytriomyces sp. MP71]
MEEAFHGEMKKADMFIDIHERYFRNRAEIKEECKMEADSKRRKAEFIEEMIREGGVEGLSVKDLEGMLQTKKGLGSKKSDIRAINADAEEDDGKNATVSKPSDFKYSRGSAGFEAFIPTHVPTFLG